MEAISGNISLPMDTWNKGLSDAGIQIHPNYGFILNCIGLGVARVWQDYANETHGKPPLMVVPTGLMKKPLEGKLAYVHEDKAIVATQSWLRSMANFSVTEQVEYFGGSGEVFFVGKMPQASFFSGCEEGDHALWRREGHPDSPLEHGGMATLLAEYDASPVEFRALQRQLEIAQRYGFDEAIQSIFRVRIANAEKIRSLLKIRSHKL